MPIPAGSEQSTYDAHRLLVVGGNRVCGGPHDGAASWPCDVVKAVVLQAASTGAALNLAGTDL